MTSKLILRIICVFWFSSWTQGYLNLYLDRNETLRLLGVDYQLSYVREGITNHYALSFDMPLRSNINHLFFTWQNLRSDKMFYKMSFNVSNPPAMQKPTTNISESGEVPKDESVFKVSLPCTGFVSAEVLITITITINMLNNQEPTTLNFRRKKVCHKRTSVWSHKGRGKLNAEFAAPLNKGVATPLSEGVPTSLNEGVATPGFNPPGFGPGGVWVNNSFMTAVLHAGNGSSLSKTGDKDTTSTHMFYVAAGIACSVIFLIAIVVAAYYFNTKKGADQFNKKMKSYDSSSSQALTGQTQTFLRPDTPNNVSGSVTSSGFRRGVSPSSDLKPVDINTILCDVLLDRKRISLGDLLLEGTFGRIYIGTLIGEDENEAATEQEVFIKTVTDQANADQVQLFLTEAVLLKGLQHPNVQHIAGACLDRPEQPLVVYPYAQEGNMKKFLLKCRMSECGSRHALNTQQIVYMAVQLIRGIQYLHRKKLVHKDIATRNCIMDTELIVKITDNALARDLFPGDYNCLGDNENRPVKWMAIEALQEKRFSSASDVWAFGVTLWEMMTLGQQPYAEVDPFEMTAYLQEGYRIAKPHNCPDELFSLMACCWALSPDERPKFQQLLVYLQNFYMALGRYI